jgi:CheY-like chemotaxis protein
VTSDGLFKQKLIRNFVSGRLVSGCLVAIGVSAVIVYQTPGRQASDNPPMTKRVLDVGNCVPDHAAIRGLVERNFDAKVVQADDLASALAELQKQPVDLVLVNRKLDLDYSDGLTIVRHLKADPQWSATPVMLITNYPEYQAEAVTAGAEPGFGKQELRTTETLEKLRRFLA